ncbi:hypothetical protein ACNNMX_02115 [Aerococcus viridans]|uniref:hypothetical protein n=1 Tax=Aerococcus viridans TaxID=1377 RepID=UPI003AA8A84C
MTVSEIVQELYILTQSDIKDENGDDITYQYMQDMFYQEVENLADALGIELKDPWEE